MVAFISVSVVLLVVVLVVVAVFGRPRVKRNSGCECCLDRQTEIERPIV